MLTFTSSPCGARLASTELTFGKSATLGSPAVLATRAPLPARRVDVQFVAGKMKTRKAAAKRYKVTASGKVIHRRPGKAHLNGPKSTERKSRLSAEVSVGSSQLPLVRSCLPYAKM